MTQLVGVTWGARIHPRTETGRRGATPFGRAVNLRSAGGKTPHGQEAKSEVNAKRLFITHMTHKLEYQCGGGGELRVSLAL